MSSQLLRALRGRRSQAVFSRRLGYRGRPVADWESGRRFPTAATLFRACAISQLDLAAALDRFHPGSAAAFGAGGDDGVAAWLRGLRASTTIAALSSRSGLPRFSVGRWLSGASRPRVPQFLALVDALTDRASDFVGELIDIDRVPALGPIHHMRSAAKRLAFDEPWTAGVLRVLETEDYQRLPVHTCGWIAARLAISQELEQRCLQGLHDAGMADVDAATGKYVCTPVTVDTRASAQEMRDLKAHWARVGVERLTRAADNDVFSFNVISVSAADLDQIRGILRSAYREIRGLVAASSPVEEVALIQLQLASLTSTATSSDDPGALQPALRAIQASTKSSSTVSGTGPLVRTTS